MDFGKTIASLYSEDKNEICEVINTASHIAELNMPINTEGIHTGFYCQVQTGMIFKFIYVIEQKKLCYQGLLKGDTGRSPIGAPMIIGLNDVLYEYRFLGNKKLTRENLWYTSYDSSCNKFHLTHFASDEMNGDKYLNFKLDNNDTISAFTIHRGADEIFEYPFSISPKISRFYKSNNFAVNMPINYNNHGGYYESCNHSYGKYRGSYAQDIEDLSDDFIDDVLGGVPEAYWNID